MRTEINNFCGGCLITISGHVHPKESIGAVVSITQGYGALSFQHSMRPAQAREMAKALIAAADELDVLQEGTVAA